MNEARDIGLSGERSEGYDDSLLQRVAQLEVQIARENDLRNSQSLAECGEREANLKSPMSEAQLSETKSEGRDIWLDERNVAMTTTLRHN